MFLKMTLRLFFACGYCTLPAFLWVGLWVAKAGCVQLGCHKIFVRGFLIFFLRVGRVGCICFDSS